MKESRKGRNNEKKRKNPKRKRRGTRITRRKDNYNNKQTTIKTIQKTNTKKYKNKNMNKEN